MDRADELNVVIDRISDGDNDVQLASLNMLTELIKGNHMIGSTASNTRQFLNENIRRLEEAYSKMDSGYNKRYLADLLSVILSLNDDILCLNYRVNGSVIPLSTWGYRYARMLLKQIIKQPLVGDDVRTVFDDCIDLLFKYNLEVDAIDFLDEAKEIGNIVKYVDAYNYGRVVLYLYGLSKYNPEYLKVLLNVHCKMKRYSSALVCMIMMGGDGIPDFINSMESDDYKLQFLFMISRYGFVNVKNYDMIEKVVFSNGRDVDYILHNQHIRSFFEFLCTDLEIREPKEIVDILKGSDTLRHEREVSVKLLAPICISNNLVHLGFERDTIFLPGRNDPIIEIDFDELGRSSKTEVISIFASRSLLNLYNFQGSLANDDLFSDMLYKKTGAILGLSLCSSKVFDPNHTACALALENMDANDIPAKIASLMAIQSVYSCAYSNATVFSDVDNKIINGVTVLVASESFDVSCFSSLVLGCLFLGNPNPAILRLLTDNIIKKSSSTSDNPLFIALILGISFLFFRNNSYAETLEELKSKDVAYYSHVDAMIRSMASFGTGDTELINEILYSALDGTDEKDVGFSSSLLKCIGMFSIALISSDNELFRRLAAEVIASSSLLENSWVRSTIPLCLALLNPSNPVVELVDNTSKLCNTSDNRTIINAIFALGVLGGGTNDSRISDVLEQQYGYNGKIVKINAALNISQGLLYLGKGTMTLSPYMFNKMVVNPRSFVGLLTPLFLLIDSERSPILSKYLFLNYLFVQAASIKQVVTIDKDLNFTKTQLKVGTPTNNVGMVGNPRRIASVKTHTSPVIVQEHEMVEIGEDETVTPLTDYIEDIVIVKGKEK